MTEEKMFNQIQALRHYGKIIADVEKELDIGICRFLTIEYNNTYYLCGLLNGEAKMIQTITKKVKR